MNEFGTSTERFYKRDSNQILWNELLMLMTETNSAIQKRQEVKGRPSKLWLKECVLDNGSSAVLITGEQGNKQCQREPWVKVGEPLWRYSCLSGGK